MNSYNENLHSSVVSSLNAQELELQKLKSQVDASTFSMYYAQGARITAEEKLTLTTDKYEFQQKVHKEAIIDSDLSTNVLTSAKNVKSYVTKSITNTAVAAANIQIAANAILKLASNTGSIFSIVNAADFDTDIYTQSKNAYDLMNITAYDAEKASQHSMEASSLIAEVSAVTLADKATVTDTSVKNLLSVVSSQLDAVTTELATETNNLATTNTTEKKTEGNLEDLNAAYHATEMAYSLTNRELNLDLSIVLPDSDESFIGDETNYTVDFFPMQTPFTDLFPSESENADEQSVWSEYNPVEAYYIMLVKASKKDTFAISEADGLVAKDDVNQYIKIPQQEYTVISRDVFDGIIGKTSESVSQQKLEDIIKNLSKISKKVFTSELLDTDGDKMSLGKEYAIFVYAELRVKYKKVINTFDNYLSAASEKFILTNQLNAPEATSIIVKPNGTPVAGSTTTETGNDTEITIDQTLTFDIWEDPDYTVAYRCMFLPHTTDLIKGLLTIEGLEAIESETEGLEKIADKYDPKISSTSAKITSMQSEISGIDTQIVEVKKQIKSTKASLKKTGNSDEEVTAQEAHKAKLEAELVSLTASKMELTDELEEQEKLLKAYKEGKSNATESLGANKTQLKPGFYFDLLMAEQVPAGSYTTAEDVKNSELNKLSKDIITIIADINKLGYDFRVSEEDSNRFKEIFLSIKEPLNTLKSEVKEDENIDESKNKIKTFLDNIENDPSDQISSLETSINEVEEDGIITKIKTDFDALINDLKNFVDDLSSVTSLLLFLEDISILASGAEYLLKGYACTRKQMTLKPETTDNFGNRLITDKVYVPVVLSNINDTSVEENTQFSNALSDFQNTEEFTYITTNQIDLINFKTLSS